MLYYYILLFDEICNRNGCKMVKGSLCTLYYILLLDDI